MKREIRSLAVFCGSSGAVHPDYLALARTMGTFLAGRGIRLVYGGGRVGLMGAMADAALAGGGEVIGVIPEKLLGLEVGHKSLTELHVVDSMHTRKAKMADLSDGFVAMPGGYGTLDEICEVTTWTQLNYHLKPVGLLNVRGYFDHFVAFLRRAGEDGFIRPVHHDLMQCAENPETLLEKMAACDIPELGRWIDKV